MEETRVPLTLLTGFLGAGKSTFLNRVLAHQDVGGVAIIVNEYGDIGLDHDLIEAADEDVTLLSSGCICCSIRGDLAKTIPDLIDRRSRGEVDFQRIVLETTGLADPGPVQRTLITDRALAPHVYLDGIVTLVDAVHGSQTLDAHFEAVSQVAMADLILLSKTDLAAVGETQALMSRVKGLNASATIMAAPEAAQHPSVLWGLTGVRRDVTAPEALDWVLPSQSAATPLTGLNNHSGLAPTPAVTETLPHDDRISTAAIEFDTPIVRRDFGLWLDRLGTLRGANILRIKGIVFLVGEDVPYVFHGVQHIYDNPVPLQNWHAGDTTSRIVIIARDVPVAELEDHLVLLPERASR